MASGYPATLPHPAQIHDVKAALRWLRANAAQFNLDPTRIGPGPLETRFDLPGGAGRLYGEAEGIEHVFVNGAEVVRGRTFTDARPGVLLRSGRDTTTVTP